MKTLLQLTQRHTISQLICGCLLLAVMPLWAQNVDYDTDNDGLIEISNLDQLNALRWDLDGNGAVPSGSNRSNYAAAFPKTAGNTNYKAIACGDNPPTTTCTGYELMNNLDFKNGSTNYS